MFENQINRQVEAALAPLSQRIEKLQQVLVHQEKVLEQQQGIIAELQGMIAELQDRLERYEAAAKEGTVPMPASVAEKPTAAVRYLGAPSADGVFREQSLAYEAGKSLYRLEADGSFSMIDEPEAIATALISVSQMVKPACKIEGSVSPSARKVQTLQLGQAEPSADGSFAIVQKCVVRFK